MVVTLSKSGQQLLSAVPTNTLQTQRKSYTLPQYVLLIFLAQCLTKYSDAFSLFRCRLNFDKMRLLTSLSMGKSRNKQAELLQKLEKAKQQNLEIDPVAVSKQSIEKMSDEKIKERNDRMRFEELLKNGGASVLNDYSSDGYLSKSQEEEEITASISGVDRIFEGDPAPTECFEELVSIKSENAIGSTGKLRLVPWLRKSSSRHDDYLVIITEPRVKSTFLYETIKVLMTELTPEIRDRMIIVNADSPAENRRWMKRNKFDDEKLLIYSDEKREFMRSYTALGQNRWTMSMFIIRNGKVQKIARDIDQYGASRTVMNAVKALSEARI